MSSDGALIVIHDDKLDRTTNGSGFVYEHTLEELKKLDAGARFSEQFSGTNIPTLEEVFSALGRVRYQIELKHSYRVYPNIENKLLEIINCFGMSENVELTSFDFDSLEILARLDSRIERGILFRGKVRWFLGIARQLRVQWLHMESDLLDSADLNAAHAADFKVDSSANDYADIRRVLDLGVDQITTDYPDKVSQVRGRSIGGS
jgi:glycerophosphoryl diester phosphodiesterase